MVRSIETSFVWRFAQVEKLRDENRTSGTVHSSPQVGQRVSAGETVAWSASLGFSPEPHVHVEAHLQAEPNASVPFALRGADDPSARSRREGGVLDSRAGKVEKSTAHE